MLVRVRHRAHLSPVPSARPVRRADHRADLIMLYREAGQFKTNYAADVAVFPILQDRIGLAVILFIAAVIIPWLGSSFLIQAVMIPFLVFSVSAIAITLSTTYSSLLTLFTA